MTREWAGVVDRAVAADGPRRPPSSGSSTGSSAPSARCATTSCSCGSSSSTPSCSCPTCSHRRGRSQDLILDADRRRRSAPARPTATIRAGDPAADRPRRCCSPPTASCSSAHTMVDDDVTEDDLDAELRHPARRGASRHDRAATPRSRPGLAGVPDRRRRASSSASASPAPASRSTRSPAASRVLAVDAHDLAFGTSRWSSKLVHGGLRYLANGQVGVAHESAVERGILMEVTAPHLTHALPMLVPLTSERRPRVQAALARGGLLRRRPAAPRRPHQRARRCPRPRRISAHRGARAGARRCAAPGCAAACSRWDGQLEDDARLVTTIARTAASYGAHVRTRARVLSRRPAPASTLRDELHRRDPHRHARGRSSTRPASGPATSSTRSRCGPAAAPTWCCAPTTLPGLARRGHRAGARARPTASCWCSPSPTARSTSASPTSRSTGDDPRRARADRGRDRLPARRGRRPRSPGRCAAATWSARSPGCARCSTPATARPPTSPASTPCSPAATGVVTIVGGKLTTYRRMAEDAVDAAVAHAGLDGRPVPHPRPAAARRRAPRRAGPARAARPAGPPLRHRRRAGARQRAATVTGLGDDELLAPVADGVPVTLAELVFGVTHEGAVDVDDLLDRRTRVGLVPADRAAAVPLAAARWPRSLSLSGLQRGP